MQLSKNLATKTWLPWLRQCRRIRHDDFLKWFLGKATKFSGYNLNGLEDIHLQKFPPVWIAHRRP